MPAPTDGHKTVSVLLPRADWIRLSLMAMNMDVSRKELVKQIIIGYLNKGGEQ